MDVRLEILQAFEIWIFFFSIQMIHKSSGLFLFQTFNWDSGF
jgi:hypothetical protein